MKEKCVTTLGNKIRLGFLMVIISLIVIASIMCSFSKYSSNTIEYFYLH